MTFFSKRKRKNDDPPRFPAWVIVLIAIGLVIIVELIFQPTSTSTSSLVVNQPQGDIELTATYIIQQATAMAQGTPQPGLSPSNNTLDPIEMTATFIVKQATQQAGTPNS